jgi:hypothetical protein
MTGIASGHFDRGMLLTCEGADVLTLTNAWQSPIPANLSDEAGIRIGLGFSQTMMKVSDQEIEGQFLPESLENVQKNHRIESS